LNADSVETPADPANKVRRHRAESPIAMSDDAVRAGESV
jgi:hypothetical protein